MARPKRDWRALFVRYQKQNQKTGISIKEWCSRNKISYSLARQNFSKIRAEITEKQGSLSDQLANKADNSSGLTDTGLNSPQNTENSEFFLEQPIVNRGGAPEGNTNAFIHGVYQDVFGEEIWAASPDMSREFRYLSLTAKMLRADSKAGEYLKEAKALQQTLIAEERAATDDEYERLKDLDRKIESSLVASSMVNTQIENMDNNVENRAATRAATAKTIADTRRIGAATRKLDQEVIKLENENSGSKFDSDNKKLQGELLRANVDRTKKEIELKDAQIEQIKLNHGDEDGDDFNSITAERDQLLSELENEVTRTEVEATDDA